LSPLLGSLLVALVVVAGVVSFFGDRSVTRLERAAGQFSRKKTLVIICLGLAAALARLALLPLLPVPVPTLPDEFSYLLAADTFVHGRLTNPPHPMWVFFDTFHVLQHPTYASKYPPGPGAAMALGEQFGDPWIGVLLSTAGMVMAVTWMLQGWVPPPWALLGGVLVLVRLGLFNQWFDNYYDSSLAVIGGALVLGAFPRILKSRRLLDGLLFGTGAVVLACTRTFEGFVFCIPIVIALVVLSKRTFNRNARSLLVPVVPALLVLIAGLTFLAYYNARVTGNALEFPWALYQRNYFNYSAFFWQKPGPPLSYSNPQFEEFFNRYQRGPNSKVSWKNRVAGTFWAWWYAYPGPFLTIPLVMTPRLWQDRRMRVPWIVCGVCALGLLSVVWFQPSYAAPVAAAFFILLVQGMRHLRHIRFRGRPVGVFLTRMVVIAAWAWAMVQTVHAARYPTSKWSDRRAAVAATLADKPGQHLVLVRYLPSHNPHKEWVYNAADIDHAKIVWAREIPGLDLRPLLDYYRDRSVWLVEADLPSPSFAPYRAPKPALADALF
jgi:hypothetical protein